MNTRDLNDALSSLGSTAFDGIVYRHVAPAFDCHSGEGARIRGGRWNPPASVPTIYTALSRETAAAELLRLAELSGQSLEVLLPRRLCLMQARVRNVVDLRSAAALSTLGLSPVAVRSRDPRRCQATGEAAYKLGLEGLLAHSATNVGDVLVVFSLNLSGDSKFERVGEEQWSEVGDLPVHR